MPDANESLNTDQFDVTIAGDVNVGNRVAHIGPNLDEIEAQAFENRNASREGREPEDVIAKLRKLEKAAHGNDKSPTPDDLTENSDKGEKESGGADSGAGGSEGSTGQASAPIKAVTKKPTGK